MTPLFYLDDYVWVREGEQVVIPGTKGEYFIKNKEFILETYDENDEKFKDALQRTQGSVPSNYQSNVIIYKQKEPSLVGMEPELEKVVEDEIWMNHPLKFDGYTLYQAGYQLNEFKSMSFKVYELNDIQQKSLGEFTIDLTTPEFVYELENGFSVEIGHYYPDYYLDDDEPRSKTKYPKNPAFVFLVHSPNADKPEVSFAGIEKNIDATGENQYKLGITDYEMRNVSGLSVRRDYTLPLFGLGALIFMVGVIQGMYWQHRRIWIHPKDGGILLAGHTNKNWFGVKQDIEKIISGTDINMVDDQQELDE